MSFLNIIPFNKPFLTGNETKYIEQSVLSGKISGDGLFSRKCHEFFEKRFGFKKALLTTSCTDALEMAAILLDIKEGDEVIAPSFTFVSTVNAFILRGASIVFADSHPYHPNIDANLIEGLITSKTKVIIAVHYAGFACDMDKIMEIAHKHDLFVVEDAAQAIDNRYLSKKTGAKILGSIGHIAAFSFHETKNIISGEGGLVIINKPELVSRAEIIREKGTNRSAFFRGEIDKYGWIDIGSSFLPSDIIAAFLWAQLENLDNIQNIRKSIWNNYYDLLLPLQHLRFIHLPQIPSYSENNGHMFYLVVNNLEVRTNLIEYLKKQGIFLTFHYVPLHKSKFYVAKHNGRKLPNCDHFSDCLVRLPFFNSISKDEIKRVVVGIYDFFGVSLAN